MTGYLLRRVAVAFSSVVAISFAAFVAFGLSLDPTYPLILGGRHNPQRVALQHTYHLTDPILVRYWLWLKGLFAHGFGTTVMPSGVVPSGPVPGDAIGPAVWSAAAVTAQLVVVSLVAVVVLSVAVGTVSARVPGSPLDLLLRGLAYVSWSVPTFVVGIELLAWLDPNGRYSVGAPGGGFVRWVEHMALPVATLSLGLIGVYSRYIRSAMIVSLHEPYAVVARAKGLPERRVVLGHALRNSLLPFVSVLSLEFGAVVGASLAADFVFHMGGIATLFLRALGEADPFELTAVVVVLAAVVSAFIALADLAIGWLDPRVRVGVGAGAHA
jgi:peptide/nickel transport system permease protein